MVGGFSGGDVAVVATTTASGDLGVIKCCGQPAAGSVTATALCGRCNMGCGFTGGGAAVVATAAVA